MLNQTLKPEIMDFFEERIKGHMQRANLPRRNFELCESGNEPMQQYGQKQKTEWYHMDELWTKDMLKRQFPDEEIEPIMIIRWHKFLPATTTVKTETLNISKYPEAAANVADSGAGESAEQLEPVAPTPTDTSP